MNEAIVRDVLRVCAERQVRNPRRYPHKERMKRDAAAMVSTVARPGERVIEFGGDDWYHPFFDGLTIDLVNLPDDMHDYQPAGDYDGAICMHVLEHSPFPLFVLTLLKLAVRPGGWVYFVVPRPRAKWSRESPPHITVMPPGAWDRLRELAGLDLIARGTGQYNPRRDDVEERFLCRRALDEDRLHRRNL